MEITDKVADSAHAAYDKIAHATSEAAETLVEKGKQLKKTEERMMKHCCSYISENPMTSVSIAAAAGFLLSRLLSRP
ncbi:MAG: glycine zipper domain-containing protein [Methylobacter sp.]